ncbi:MAG: VOC family protein [Bacteroidota bacterium]
MNQIVFADLSTYTPEKTMAFYKAVFGWTFYNDHGYYLAYQQSREIIGLYETPEKFKQMRMPHFWMTYIQVENVGQTVAKVKALGGIIELVDESNPIGGVALIRDPQGAGFTIYDGNQLHTRTNNEVNTLVWNELHVSDMQKVKLFYQGLFDWIFYELARDHYQIYTSDEVHTADALNIPNEYKGKYEYWVCTFGVDDLDTSSETILKQGGSLIMDEGKRRLFTDDSGQAFFYIQEVSS